MSPPKHVTVLGAGLTGLTTAYHLSHLLPSSSKITLVEGSNRLGGWMNSTKVPVSFRASNGETVEGEAVIEAGPRSIRPRGSRGASGMLKLVRDLELLDSIIPIPNSHPAAKNRYLLDPHSSKLIKLPSSIFSILSRQPPLLRGLFRSILSEPFKRRLQAPDESLDSFIRRRLGNNVADNLISAMVHGIYAASSTDLSVRSTFEVLFEAEKKYGSIVLGMLRGTKSSKEKMEEREEWAELGSLGKEREGWSLYGFKGGLGVLSDRLAEVIEKRGVEVRIGDKVEGLILERQGVKISMKSSTSRPISSCHVISTISPYHLSSLLPSSTTLPHLTANPSTSVGVVNLIYPLAPPAIHPSGFGYLIPRTTPGLNAAGILGVVFDSTALPGVDGPTLEGKITKMTVMIGGPHWTTYPSSTTSDKPLEIPSSPEALVPLAVNHLQGVFPHLAGIQPILTRSMIHKDCIPTYLPGHGARLRELHEAIQNSSWSGRLSVAGNGYGGVGVNDCVLMAQSVAKGLAAGQGATGLERWADWE